MFSLIRVGGPRSHQVGRSTISLGRAPATAAASSVRHMATKKQGGSTTNGRDSAGRRLGIKIFPGHVAKAGSILVRQRGMKFKPGSGVGIGKDHTLFAKLEGLVQYTRNERNRNVVHVINNMG